MTDFYLVRHGQALSSLAAERGLRGWGNDLVPLTPLGVEQIEQLARTLRTATIEVIVSSPMTRALQSAAILSRLLDAPLNVEFDLHEWIPDRSFAWESTGAFKAAFAEYSHLGGEWPPGEERQWEPLSAMRQRVRGVLTRYRQWNRVVAVSHSDAISSLTGRVPDFATVSEYRL